MCTGRFSASIDSGWWYSTWPIRGLSTLWALTAVATPRVSSERGPQKHTLEARSVTSSWFEQWPSMPYICLRTHLKLTCSVAVTPNFKACRLSAVFFQGMMIHGWDLARTSQTKMNATSAITVVSRRPGRGHGGMIWWVQILWFGIWHGFLGRWSLNITDININIYPTKEL